MGPMDRAAGWFHHRVCSRLWPRWDRVGGLAVWVCDRLHGNWWATGP